MAQHPCRRKGAPNTRDRLAARELKLQRQDPAGSFSDDTAQVLDLILVTADNDGWLWEKSPTWPIDEEIGSARTLRASVAICASCHGRGRLRYRT